MKKKISKSDIPTEANSDIVKQIEKALANRYYFNQSDYNSDGVGQVFVLPQDNRWVLFELYAGSDTSKYYLCVMNLDDPDNTFTQITNSQMMVPLF